MYRQRAMTSSIPSSFIDTMVPRGNIPGEFRIPGTDAMGFSEITGAMNPMVNTTPEMLTNNNTNYVYQTLTGDISPGDLVFYANKDDKRAFRNYVVGVEKAGEHNGVTRILGRKVSDEASVENLLGVALLEPERFTSDHVYNMRLYSIVVCLAGEVLIRNYWRGQDVKMGDRLYCHIDSGSKKITYDKSDAKTGGTNYFIGRVSDAGYGCEGRDEIRVLLSPQRIL